MKVSASYRHEYDVAVSQWSVHTLEKFRKEIKTLAPGHYVVKHMNAHITEYVYTE